MESDQAPGLEGRRNPEPDDLKPFEPLMDAILEPYTEQLPDERPYDAFGITDKARYLTGIVTGEHEVRDDVTYNAPDGDGHETSTEFSVPDLYRWLRAVRGRPRDGSEPFQEMRDVPAEFRTGNEAELVENLNRQPQYKMHGTGMIDPDANNPDPAVGGQDGTTLAFETW